MSCSTACGSGMAQPKTEGIKCQTRKEAIAGPLAPVFLELRIMLPQRKGYQWTNVSVARLSSSPAQALG